MDLEKLDGLTPGPWERYGLIGNGGGLDKVRAVVGHDRLGRPQYVDIPANESDASAVVAIPALLAEVRAMREENESLRARRAAAEGVLACIENHEHGPQCLTVNWATVNGNREWFAWVGYGDRYPSGNGSTPQEALAALAAKLEGG